MGGSKKMQQVRSIANRPQGGGNKKQGLPPSIGRAGWFSNFIRTNAGGYFRSIPGPVVICPEKIWTGDLTIENLAELEALSGYTKIIGYLRIKDSDDITNLSNLNCLNNITGDLIIRDNAVLANINGLGKLTSVGDSLIIYSNPKLTNINGLSELTSVGGKLDIQNNKVLTNINGLAKLTSIGGDLKIEYNISLESITGLNAVTTIATDITVKGNTPLAGADKPTKLANWGVAVGGRTAMDGTNGEDFSVAARGVINLLPSN